MFFFLGAVKLRTWVTYKQLVSKYEKKKQQQQKNQTNKQTNKKQLEQKVQPVFFGHQIILISTLQWVTQSNLLTL